MPCTIQTLHLLLPQNGETFLQSIVLYYNMYTIIKIISSVRPLGLVFFSTFEFRVYNWKEGLLETGGRINFLISE